MGFFSELRKSVGRSGFARSDALLNKYCCICDSKSEKFLDFGVKPRPGVRCPKCGSLERHRLVFQYLVHSKVLQKKGRLLHIAPEKCLAKVFTEIPHIDHVCVDLDKNRSEFVMDLTRLKFPDEFFDSGLCSHVLEHIQDDLTAMRELYRVTKQGGVQIIVLPLRGQTTFEDPTICTPEARLVAYGQADHVRYYGMDVVERLQSVGFAVAVENCDFIPTPLREKMVLPRSYSPIFVCRRIKSS